MANKMDLVEQAFKKEKPVGEFNIGDTVEVHFKTETSAKTKIQRFIGVCIAKQHGGIREAFSVRRVVAGEGVERTFPVHSPIVEKVVVTRKAKVRRAKLYYLRERFGKKARLKIKLDEKKKK